MARKRDAGPKPARPAKKTVNLLPKGFTFEHLVKSIHAVHSEAAVQATRAVNLSLTLRNWLIGCYIAEYELRGNDRATYGEKLLDSLAAEPTRFAVSNTNRRQLYRYLRFYRTYPGMVGACPHNSEHSSPQAFRPARRKWGHRPHNRPLPPRPSLTGSPTDIWN